MNVLKLILAIAILLALLVNFGAMLPPTAGSNSGGIHLGFWVDERDMWSGSGYAWSAQTFFKNYFLTAPYPSGLIFATSMSPTGSSGMTWQGEAQWLNSVATLADSYPNTKIIILFFVNLSGGTINGVPDQTQQLTTYMSYIKGHSSIYGAEYEREYYGNTVQEVSTFKSIINGAGYVNIDDPSQATNFPSDPVLDYSTYPYFGGTIPTSLPSGSRSVGVGYGETGAPNCSTQTCPAWTQSVITSIVNTSPSAQYTFIYSSLDSNNPAGGTIGNPLWNSAMLRSWIWNDPSYTSNYVLSTSMSTSITTTTVTSSTDTTTKSTSSTSTTHSSTSTTSYSTTTSISSTSTTQQSSTSSIVSTTTLTTLFQTSSTLLTGDSSSSSSTSITRSSSTDQPVSVSSSHTSNTSSSASQVGISSQPGTNNALALAPGSKAKGNALTFGFAGYEIALIAGLPLISKTLSQGRAKKAAYGWRW